MLKEVSRPVSLSVPLSMKNQKNPNWQRAGAARCQFACESIVLCEVTGTRGFTDELTTRRVGALSIGILTIFTYNENDYDNLYCDT